MILRPGMKSKAASPGLCDLAPYLTLCFLFWVFKTLKPLVEGILG